MSSLPPLTRKMIAPRFFAVAEIDPDKVDRYETAMAAGERFPPVVVARYGDRVMPLEGHHRLSAAERLGCDIDAIECDGEAFEDFSCEVGSAEADRLVLKAAAIMT